MDMKQDPEAEMFYAMRDELLALKELCREIIMRTHVALPMTEQDMKWFDQGMHFQLTKDLIEKIGAFLGVAKPDQP